MTAAAAVVVATAAEAAASADGGGDAAEEEEEADGAGDAELAAATGFTGTEEIGFAPPFVDATALPPSPLAKLLGAGALAALGAAVEGLDADADDRGGAADTGGLPLTLMGLPERDRLTVGLFGFIIALGEIINAFPESLKFNLFFAASHPLGAAPHSFKCFSGCHNAGRL